MAPNRKILVLLKGYPRLSETFIAQELLGLEKAGFELALVAMRRPTDKKRHPVHDEIRATVDYLPEYLHEEPVRVLKAIWKIRHLPGFGPALKQFWRDFRRDMSRNRVRRFGQAAVLVAEWPRDARWLHVHFIHTPASVASYASQISGIPWTVSAHAKDIWTSKDWDLAEKLERADWAVTCTAVGYDKLNSLSGGRGNVNLSYHGLDLERFPHFDDQRSLRDGQDPTDPVRILRHSLESLGQAALRPALALHPYWRRRRTARLKGSRRRTGDRREDRLDGVDGSARRADTIPAGGSIHFGLPYYGRR
jgi:hypothetical protein